VLQVGPWQRLVAVCQRAGGGYGRDQIVANQRVDDQPARDDVAGKAEQPDVQAPLMQRGDLFVDGHVEQVQVDAGPPEAELADNVGKQRIGGTGDQPEPDATLDPGGDTAGRRDRPVGLLDGACDPVDQGPAGVGERHRAGRAVKQHDPVFVLEGPHGPGQGGLGSRR